MTEKVGLQLCKSSFVSLITLTAASIISWNCFVILPFLCFVNPRLQARSPGVNQPSIFFSAEALRITNLGFPSAFYHKVSDPIFLLLQRNGDIIGVHSRTPMISPFFIRKIDGVLFISFFASKESKLTSVLDCVYYLHTW